MIEKIMSTFRSILNHSVTKNSIIVLAGSMFANFFAYLYHLTVGRILGPEKYGELAALLSLIYLLNVPAQGLQTVMTKYFSSFKARQQTGEAKSLFLLATKWMLLLEVIGFIILLPLLNKLADFLHISTKENFIWLYLIFSTYLISVIQLSSYQAYQLFFASSVLTNTGAALRLIAGAMGALFGVSATLLSNVLTNLVMYIVSFLPLSFIIKVKSEPVSISKRHILGYSIPTLITALGITALYSQDVILVKHFFAAREAGIYSSLSILGKVIFYASSALGFVLFPVVAERSELDKSHRSIVWTGLAVIALISFTLTAFYFLFPKSVVDLLFGKAFYEAVPYLGYFGLFISFFSLSSLLTSVCLASGKTAVWALAVLGAIAQTASIWMFHGTLLGIVQVNLAVTAGLFFLLLLYYGYAKGES